MKQEINELIDIELINFYRKIVDQEPNGILMNANNLKKLIDSMFFHFGTVKTSEYIVNNGCKYRGIDIMISENLKDNEIKIVL